MAILDLTDKLARFPVSYGYQPIRGWAVKHFDTVVTQNSRRTKQNALGEGPWDGPDKLWADAFEIPESDYIFHPGMGDDAPDANFPDDAPHPWTAYISARCKEGLSEAQTDNLFGIYRTLRTPNYNGAGQQLNSGGSVVSPADPRTAYFFKPNPANCAIDQVIRWGKRSPVIVNYPAWVDWRDWNDEGILWDDAKYTPRSLSLSPSASGSLTPGTTIYVRVSTIRGADESSASQKTLETKADSILLLSGETSFQVNWLIKGDEEDTPAPPGDITGYRVYLGTTPGVWLGYVSIGVPTQRSYTVVDLAGLTGGSPLDNATTGLLRTIKRFECGLHFIPPYDLAGALSRICQTSCADWQWSGLGTGTYRNDKIRFMSPVTRAPVFTLNLAETGMGSFRTYPVDRRTRPNQVIVTFRDRDDPFLAEAQPVILDREQLQLDDGVTKPYVIEGGTIFRSQAQRIANFWARVLCDMDQFAAMRASPKSYHVLPGDVVKVTNDTPNWVDIQFMVTKKEESVEQALGDPFSLQLYSPDLYSDTAHSPLARPLPTRPLDPFAKPLPATDLVLTVDTVFDNSFKVDFHFQPTHVTQKARIYIKGPVPGLGDPEPDDAAYRQITTVVPNSALEGHYQSPAIAPGIYWIQVVTESNLGQSVSSGHPVESMDLNPLAPTDLASSRDPSFDWFSGADGHPRISELPASYVFRFTRHPSGDFLRDIPVTTGISLAMTFPETAGFITVDKNNLSSTHVDNSLARSAQKVTGPGQFMEFTLPALTVTGGGTPVMQVAFIPEPYPGPGSWILDSPAGAIYSMRFYPKYFKWFASVNDLNSSGPGSFGDLLGVTQTITGATNANPIVITSPNHGLATGQTVEITGVLGNTAANGIWEATFIDENHYSIANTGNGAYTSGGTAEWLSFAMGAGPVAVRAVFFGTEVRFYKNWALGRKPFAISRMPNEGLFPFRIRAHFFTGAETSYKKLLNFVIGTSEDPQVIYSKAQQETDLLRLGELPATAALGVPEGELGEELWQTSRYPNARGTSVTGVF